MNALIALEDGTWFEGETFAGDGEVTGELVFNTSMTGYQEILTDPSYRGQIVTLTYPLIGNYGICPEDMESGRPHCSALVVGECSRIRSNWRSALSLPRRLSSRPAQYAGGRGGAVQPARRQTHGSDDGPAPLRHHC
ncbi:MAG: carbamoyl-phosphate synthase domain-containing protein, partial [Kiritimatiellia bacterium]|nr:carbamoyl-phosphate synthase domain-containing protein [Kiritimatiellia bacterium]